MHPFAGSTLRKCIDTVVAHDGDDGIPAGDGMIRKHDDETTVRQQLYRTTDETFRGNLTLDDADHRRPVEADADAIHVGADHPVLGDHP